MLHINQKSHKFLYVDPRRFLTEKQTNSQMHEKQPSSLTIQTYPSIYIVPDHLILIFSYNSTVWM